MFNAPKFKPWIAYRDLASTYGRCCTSTLFSQFCLKSRIGSMVHFRIFGQSIMALNTADVIDELLEKRSVKHSSRPNQIFAGQMYVGDKNFASFSEHLPLAKHGRA